MPWPWYLDDPPPMLCHCPGHGTSMILLPYCATLPANHVALMLQVSLFCGLQAPSTQDARREARAEWGPTPIEARDVALRVMHRFLCGNSLLVLMKIPYAHCTSSAAPIARVAHRVLCGWPLRYSSEEQAQVTRHLVFKVNAATQTQRLVEI